MLSRRNCSKIIFIIGGFLCYLIADGCTFSIGILYNEFLNTFHKSNAETAVLPGLIYGIPQLLGSLVCPTIDIIGSGYGAMIGGFILSISIFASKYVTTFQYMYITMGLLASIGLEMTYVSGIMAVTKTFVEGNYLGLALGITVSGSGIGVFMFNPLLDYLIGEYTWTGAMLIESAIFLHVIVAGCLFRLATTMYTLPDNEEQKIQIEVITDNNNHHSIVRQVSQSHSGEALDTVSKHPVSFFKDRRSSVLLTKTQAKNCEPFYKPINTQSKSSSLDRRLKPVEQFAVQLPVDERSASFVTRLSQYGSQNIKDSSQNTKDHSPQFERTRQNSQETLSSQPSLHTDEASHASNIYIQSAYDIQLIPSQNSQSLSTFKRFLTDLKKSMLSLFSRKVWTNTYLLLFYVVILLFAMSVVVVWTFSYNHSLSIKVDGAYAALLLSLVGAGACFGQIFFGYVSSRIHAISLFSIGCIFAGLSTILLRYSVTYWCMAVLHTLFGFSQGVNYAVFSLILIHYASMELYPASLAIYLFFSGSGNLIGTSLTGYLNDVTGDFNAAFLSSGCVLIVCGVFVFPLIYAWHKDNGT